MFKETRIKEIVKMGYQREPKMWDILVDTRAYSVGYKCTSFYLLNHFLVLRTLDDGEQYINIDTILSFTVTEIKEGAKND